MTAEELSKYERMPKAAKVNQGQAWWYAMPGRIELHVAEGVLHYTVTIRRSALRRYLEKTK